MKYLSLFLLIVACAWIGGCKSNVPNDRIHVKGKVLLDENPMPGISVFFTPVSGEGQTAGGMTDEDGCFVLTTGGAPFGSGAIAGEYNVTFKKAESEADTVATYEEFKQKFGNREPKVTYIVPKKYSDSKTSGLDSVKVEKGKKNKFSFELSTQGS